MKIALISTYPPRECGIGIYTSRIANGFKYHGHDVRTISFKGHAYKDKNVIPILQKSNPLSYVKTLSYLKREKFDKVLIQHEYSFYNLIYFPIFLFLLKLFGIKTNMVMHTVEYNGAFLKKSLFLIYQRILVMFVDNLFLHSENAKRKLNKNIIFKKKALIIPHPIPVKKAVFKIPDKKKTYNILCFGFIHRTKGFDIACKAVEGLKNFNLKVVGSVNPIFEKRESRYLSNLKKMVNEYPNVELKLGFATENEKEKYFRKADFVILPYRLTEQSGVLSEVWGFHKIPICSNLKPFKDEIGNDKFGLLFEKENISDLRKKLKYISKNIEKQKEVLNNIKKLVSVRNYNSLAKKYAELMK